MFVTIFTFHVKAGQESAAIAHFDAWTQERQPRVTGFVGSDVLQDIKDSRSFIAIARFTDQAASVAIAESPEQDAWYRQLVSLCENEPVFTDCNVALHA